MFEVEGLTKNYGGLAAVSGVSFSLSQGEMVGIIGPNGAGKTTLFNLISGFERPSAGTIRLNGVVTNALSADAIARLGLARTFQIARPFGNLTVSENLVVAAFSNRLTDLVPDMRRARETADTVTRDLGLEPLRNVKAGTLPYGSQKLLEIARILALGPSVMLLDEPFAGINGAEAERLATFINGLRSRGVTVLIIEHKLSLLMRIVDRVIVMASGKLIADQPPAEIKHNPVVRVAYLGDRHDAVRT